jgi:hypothetical protein
VLHSPQTTDFEAKTEKKGYILGSAGLVQPYDCLQNDPNFTCFKIDLIAIKKVL